MVNGIKIQKEGKRYLVKLIGYQFKVYANNLDEVIASIKHHYSGDHNTKICPVCKEIMKK